MVGLSSLSVLSFELPDFLQFCFLFDFKDSLFDSFGEENIQDWLDLSVVVKEIIVPNLSVSVDTCLLRDILW